MSATDSTADSATLKELTRPECEALLRRTPIGRIGFTIANEPQILPVNYLFVDGEIVFRTSTGRKLDAISSQRQVAFEVDRWVRESRTGWSVLVVGDAEEIENATEFAEADALGLRPWAEDPDQDRLVRITPRTVTGRRL